MLPFLAPLLFKLQKLKEEHDRQLERVVEITARMRGNGHGLSGELQGAQQAVQGLAEQINEAIERVNEMGCELKDLDMGLVDFRTEMEGREVYLCWKLGEEHVSFWHDLDAGFAGRRPLEPAGD